MKKVKRSSKKNEFRLLCSPALKMVWLDLWGNSYVYLTKTQARRLLDALKIALEEE